MILTLFRAYRLGMLLLCVKSFYGWDYFFYIYMLLFIESSLLLSVLWLLTLMPFFCIGILGRLRGASVEDADFELAVRLTFYLGAYLVSPF